MWEGGKGGGGGGDFQLVLILDGDGDGCTVFQFYIAAGHTFDGIGITFRIRRSIGTSISFYFSV